jgi:hypothetical protein
LRRHAYDILALLRSSTHPQAETDVDAQAETGDDGVAIAGASTDTETSAEDGDALVRNLVSSLFVYIRLHFL